LFFTAIIHKNFPFMKNLRSITIALAMLLSIPVFSQGFRLHRVPGTVVVHHYVNPAWAPPYYEGARYYYLPDIECYYDLSTGEFIYLMDGEWRYSREIPAIYADFDLADCFTIILNNTVFRPWLHHQYYVSHYPRYYYRDYYDHNNIPWVRGFNENRKSAFYWRENERHRARQWDDRNRREDRDFRYQREDRQRQRSMRFEGRPSDNRDYNNRDNDSRKNNDRIFRDNNSESHNRNVQERSNDSRTDRVSNNDNRRQEGSDSRTERTQNTNYYGKQIGNPVKVARQMRSESRSSDKASVRFSEKKSSDRDSRQPESRR